jgi:hypothetical protein
MRPIVDRRVLPPLPLTSGAVADLIGTTEPRLSDTVRKGSVQPPPRIIAGRRLWSADQILQAATALNLPAPDLSQFAPEVA